MTVFFGGAAENRKPFLGANAIPPAEQASTVNLQMEPRCDSKPALRSPELAIPLHYLLKIHLLGWSPIPSLFFLKPYYSPRPVASATKTLTLAPELRRRSRLQMDGGGTHRTPEDVFRDFRARRAGMIKALTTGARSLSSPRPIFFSSISGVLW